MSMKMWCLAMGVCTLGACDKANSAEDGKAAVKSRQDDDKEGKASAPNADPAAYACPEVGELSVDWVPDAADTFAMAIKLPPGFVHKAPPEGPGIADFTKPVTLPSAKQAAPQDTRDYRVSFTQMALATDIRDKGVYKPYKAGTGFGEDGNRDEQMNLLVGDFDIDGRSVHVLRQPGDSGAIFDASFEEGGKFYVYKLAISLNNAVGSPDLDASPCVADFDKLGLEVLKSMKLVKK